jgi:flavodoxin
MDATIVYFSESGNTKGVAEAVAEEIRSGAKRAVAQYQVAKATQDTLVNVGVQSEQDARR